ncbi:MAG TPA: ammonium transporter [Caulobacterales bacterium]|nr:ammonium transporter [Caulobacterales bacterium]
MRKSCLFGRSLFALAAAAFLATPSLAHAQAGIDPAATAWLLTATALVLLMTIPALALFYAGLVRLKNSLSVLMHCTAITCLVSVLWFAGGYSLAFTSGGPLLGDLSQVFLAATQRDSLRGAVPETAFFMFQMTFAIITPALIVGAFAERMKFAAVMVFTALWSLIVYAPVAHWVWGGGWLAERGVLDFAGGLVVHTTAGVSALILAAAVGKRDGFPLHLDPPHNPALTMVGGAMLWVGWYGFNAGSALAADANAAMAMTVTHLSAAAAGLTWAVIEAVRFGKPSLVGMVTGVIAGLATVTPASGYIGPAAGVAIGIAASIVCFVAVRLVRQKVRIDDALDVFAVHGVGGMLGTALVAVFAAPGLGGVGYPAATAGMSNQLGVQLLAIIAVAAWSGLATYAIVAVTRRLVGLTAKPEHIEDGLDLSEHGERAFSP